LSLAALIFLGACSAPPPDESGYVDRILSDRAAKDQFFKQAEHCFAPGASKEDCSPVPPERRGQFLPLNYYDTDPSYRAPAELEVSEDQPLFDVPTSTGELRKMQKIGTLKFWLKGEPSTLSAFFELPPGQVTPVPAQTVNRLFVPFRDETSGSETYPAGRYMDLDRTATSVYDLDFNRAYHPYCYYDERYDCPFPPPENRLKAAVRAGERLPSREAASDTPSSGASRSPDSQ
jgi:uncharacterized protein (DUF1684 family)